MMKYRYTGPASGVTLADGTEVLLWPDSVVELPEAHDYVKTLVALKHLHAEPEVVGVSTSRRKNTVDEKTEVNSGS
ncbi:hypothetical protein L2164_01105 [Pectobacterium brasiliense]|uniref:hypothetical protein n=1 Tax=Pectobacterium brasiliense TaxID=180957 RepID=UPI00155DAFAE|nr:hypothetical protein [Pectobacterium brasiliense]MCG5047293.1 hypothetical protein [Pectobacterium brasiliense]